MLSPSSTMYTFINICQETDKMRWKTVFNNTQKWYSYGLHLHCCRHASVIALRTRSNTQSVAPHCVHTHQQSQAIVELQQRMWFYQAINFLAWICTGTNTAAWSYIYARQKVAIKKVSIQEDYVLQWVSSGEEVILGSFDGWLSWLASLWVV